MHFELAIGSACEQQNLTSWIVQFANVLGVFVVPCMGSSSFHATPRRIFMDIGGSTCHDWQIICQCIGIDMFKLGIVPIFHLDSTK